jgi:uncharacterized membrane protein
VSGSAGEDPVGVLLVLLVVVILFVVVGAIIEALKWLVFLGIAVLLVGLIANWSRHHSR